MSGSARGLALLFVFVSACVGLSRINPTYSIVPGGLLVPNECTHQLADHEAGASLVERVVDGVKVLDVVSPQGTLLRSIEPCPRQIYTHGSAWTAWSEYLVPTTFTNFTSDWVVPPNPAKATAAEILYLWNGVEPEDNSAVLQPVLQWGTTPAGGKLHFFPDFLLTSSTGGQYWALACWYVSSLHGTVTSKLFKTTAGNTIRGVMADNSGTWDVIGTDLQTGSTESIHYTPTGWKGNNWVYEVLEAYYTKCNGYPAEPCSFTNIALVPETPISWAAQTQNPTCGEYAEIVSEENVIIHFSKDV
ncbi:hypothetical protein Pelo_12034 [Pelomyxa schiedti]|nr:hypothetical protein Pelo_12034 [Pelomyxa schiedti]